jgi:sec-independent protein translocase protein TatB
MFGLGMQEIIVIGVLALLLLGPKKLPELAQTVGKFVRDFQHAADEVKREITTPVNEIKAELRTQAGLDQGDLPPAPRPPDPSAAAYGITEDPAPATHDTPAPAPEKTADNPDPSKHAG